MCICVCLLLFQDLEKLKRNLSLQKQRSASLWNLKNPRQQRKANQYNKSKAYKNCQCFSCFTTVLVQKKSWKKLTWSWSKKFVLQYLSCDVATMQLSIKANKSCQGKLMPYSQFFSLCEIKWNCILHTGRPKSNSFHFVIAFKILLIFNS